LVEYCQLLFKASNGELSEKALGKHLVKIENIVKNKLGSSRIEVAFISYKASMSDSLESIYLAAKDDPGVDAYWIPIPYYELESSGAVSKMVYEGAESYPDYIECTDWQQYDIELRRPDVIFTFAPYDGANYVTSIHPNFYCERLCGLTELLAYIPYSVFSDIPQDMHCTTPGCIYAHKVFVQSEKVRDTFIGVFKSEFGSMFGDPNDKFVALGSPKFDKAHNSKRDDFSMPSGWLELIEKKKVVFYNTSIAAILSDSERYLKQLRNALNTFRNNKNVVLWWRPHPLSLTTYKSMRPHLAQAYSSIVSEYRNEAWGIYDDTPDLHRAIAYTDAYYGDGSSVTALYKVTGEPVMIQGSWVITENGKMPLEFEFLCNDGDYMWFSELRCNALFKMSKITWEVEFVATIPGEKIYTPRLYSSISICNDKLYFAPLSASDIMEYTPKTGEFKIIQIGLPEIQKIKTKNKFYKSIVVDKYVFFIPYHYPGIIVYDTETRTVSCHDAWVHEVESLRTTDEHIGYFQGCAMDDSRLIFPCFCADAIVIFDTKKMTSTVWQTAITSFKHKYRSVCCSGDYYYFTSSDGIVAKRKMLSAQEDVTLIKMPEEVSDDKSNDSLPYPRLNYLDGYVWYFPSHQKTGAWKISTDTDEVTAAEMFDGNIMHNNEKRSFLFAETIDGCIYTMNYVDLCLTEYNPQTGSKREKRIDFPDDFHKVNHDFELDSIHDETGYIYENKLFTLDDMLSGLACGAPAKNEQHGGHGAAGRAILEYVKKAVM